MAVVPFCRIVPIPYRESHQPKSVRDADRVANVEYAHLRHLLYRCIAEERATAV
jgi:hypothetical protein